MQKRQTSQALHYYKDLQTSIRKTKLKYVGHVNRMGSGRYPKILLEGHIAGNRPRGRPGKRWLEDIKHFSEEADIPSVAAAGHLARIRNLWRLESQLRDLPPKGGRL